EEVMDLGFAGRVHDVGKMFVPERILNKRATLSDEDFQTLKLHTRFGGEIVGRIPGGEKVQQAIECHHECFDGSGYPSGLHGEEIPHWARIIAVADAYANLTTERSVTPAKTSEQAIAELEKSA